LIQKNLAAFIFLGTSFPLIDRTVNLSVRQSDINTTIPNAWYEIYGGILLKI